MFVCKILLSFTDNLIRNFHEIFQKIPPAFQKFIQIFPQFSFISFLNFYTRYRQNFLNCCSKFWSDVSISYLKF